MCALLVPWKSLPPVLSRLYFFARCSHLLIHSGLWSLWKNLDARQSQVQQVFYNAVELRVIVRAELNRVSKHWQTP